jgi:EAL domain-containing protein (putative c-di-GMP-specific phosphodiesterase class I)
LHEVEQALEQQQLELYYQPKISMITGELCGAEALLRWQKADGEFIPPDAYIHLAEEAGLITRITKYVFDRLVSELDSMLELNPQLVISFNVSGKDFNDNDFTQYMLKAIRGKKYPIKNIEIEVTETVLLNESQVKLHLKELSEMGVPISMDDFGTGHSGLVELTKWPFSSVKIDRALVNGIYESKANTEIVQSSIRMAHQLNMELVAEGIEDKETYILLQKYGCKIGQGFWISKPLELDAFLQYIKDYKPMSTTPVGLIYMAQLDHLQWKKNLIDTALLIYRKHQGSSAKEVVGGVPELEHTCCKLGRWYYSVGDVFKNLPEYQQLEKPHRELHDAGKLLLKAVQKNCSSQEFTQLAYQLSEKSSIIIRLLQRLEDYWMLEDI